MPTQEEMVMSGTKIRTINKMKSETVMMLADVRYFMNDPNCGFHDMARFVQDPFILSYYDICNELNKFTNIKKPDRKTTIELYSRTWKLYYELKVAVNCRND